MLLFKYWRVGIKLYSCSAIYWLITKLYEFLFWLCSPSSLFLLSEIIFIINAFVGKTNEMLKFIISEENVRQRSLDFRNRRTNLAPGSRSKESFWSTPKKRSDSQLKITALVKEYPYTRHCLQYCHWKLGYHKLCAK